MEPIKKKKPVRMTEIHLKKLLMLRLSIDGKPGE
jgi:hypothetical protein